MTPREGTAVDVRRVVPSGVCKDLTNPGVLADFMEQMTGLAATATLLRAPDLRPLPQNIDWTPEFEYYPLERDVFFWTSRAKYAVKLWTWRPCFVIGLYAHPDGLKWGKISRMIPRKESKKTDPKDSWKKLLLRHPRLEKAEAELLAFTGRSKDE